jgi:hypothetical protein
MLKDYIIAIPSYKRASLLKINTLALLKRHHISSKQIYIFVANEDEKLDYETIIPNTDYHKIIIGVKGLHHQRNFISSYFQPGKLIVEMDDDLKEIYETYNTRNIKTNISSTKTKTKKNTKRTKHTKHFQRLKPITNLHQFITTAFKTLQEKNLYLWGVYPVYNPFFTTSTITTDLRFIVGPFWGFINRHSSDLNLSLEEKEDTERTLQFFIKDGGVVRFNRITFNTNYYSTPGGMQANHIDRKAAAKHSAHILHSKYPTLTTLKTRKNGITEVKLVNPGARPPPTKEHF